jgi:hypothetical protein
MVLSKLHLDVLDADALRHIARQPIGYSRVRLRLPTPAACSDFKFASQARLRLSSTHCTCKAADMAGREARYVSTASPSSVVSFSRLTSAQILPTCSRRHHAYARPYPEGPRGRRLLCTLNERFFLHRRAVQGLQ